MIPLESPKDPEYHEEHLNQLRRLVIEKEPNLRIPTEDSEFLKRFIRVRKYDTQRAFIMLQKYYELRRKNSKYFVTLLPSILKPVLDVGMHVILKDRDRLGRQVFVFRAGLWKPQEISLDQIMSTTVLLFEEITTSSIETQKNGLIFLMDHSGLRLNHFRQFSIPQILTILSVLQGNFPIKCKGLHSVNEPSWLKTLAQFTRPFFSQKLRKRIHFHGNNLESLHKFLDPEILPDALGGKLSWQEVNDNQLFQVIYSKEDDYKEMGNYGYHP